LLPPRLVGTAATQIPNDEDLDYEFEGRPYTPPPEGAPYEKTAALTYTFAAAESGTPVKSAVDEISEPNGYNDAD
jgi:hypothetical protein